MQPMTVGQAGPQLQRGASWEGHPFDFREDRQVLQGTNKSSRDNSVKQNGRIALEPHEMPMRCITLNMKVLGRGENQDSGQAPVI